MEGENVKVGAVGRMGGGGGDNINHSHIQEFSFFCALTSVTSPIISCYSSYYLCLFKYCIF
jgi:hypothetical protein